MEDIALLAESTGVRVGFRLSFFIAYLYFPNMSGFPSEDGGVI